jgi:hypothetical protein
MKRWIVSAVTNLLRRIRELIDSNKKRRVRVPILVEARQVKARR